MLAQRQNTTLHLSCLAEHIRVKLTLHPQTEAGRELLQLTRDLWQVKSLEQAAAWQQRLIAWHETYADFIRERTNKRYQ